MFSKELVTPQAGETWLLVTSAFHMPRSVGLFRKVDFPVIPWPTDYRTSGARRASPCSLTMKPTPCRIPHWRSANGWAS